MERKPNSVLFSIGAFVVLLLLLLLRLTGNSSDKLEEGVMSGISEISYIVAETDEAEAVHIQIESETKDWGGVAPYDDAILVPVSTMRKLTKDDITGLSRDELVLAKVEILAYNGIDILDDGFHEILSDTSWYNPLIPEDEADIESILSDTELYNLEFLGKAVEDASGNNVSIVDDNLGEVATEHGIPDGVTFWVDEDGLYEIMFDKTWDDGYSAIMYIRGTDETHAMFPNDGQSWVKWDENPDVLISKDGNWKLLFNDYGKSIVVVDTTSGEDKIYPFTRVESE